MTDQEMREAVQHAEPLWGYFGAALNEVLGLGADKRLALDAMLSVAVAALEKEDGARLTAQRLFVMSMASFKDAEAQDQQPKH